MSWDPVQAFAETLPPGGLAEHGWLMRDDGLLLPPGAVEIKPPKPLAIGLFSGAGGMDCGLASAGFHVVAASEWWPTAAATYLCNLGSPETLVYVGQTTGEDWTKKDKALLAPHMGELVRAGDIGGIFESAGTGWISKAADHQANRRGAVRAAPARGRGRRGSRSCGTTRATRRGAGSPAGLSAPMWFAQAPLCDVRELTGEMILDLLGCSSDDIALVAGGPPCQGFSRSNGKRSRHDGRNQLVFEFARLVCEIHPKAMLMENVPGIVDMVTPEGVPVIDALSLILENGGMGEYDALRRSLAANAGAGAIVKGTKRQTKAAAAARRAAAADDAEHDEDAQLALEVA